MAAQRYRRQCVGETVVSDGPADENVLDLAVLGQLRTLFDGDLSDVVGTYLNDTPMQLAAIESAITRHDPAQLRRSAHTLKSTSQAVGARRVAELALRLESLGSAAGPMDAAPQLLSALRTAARATETPLREAMQHKGDVAA